MDDTKKTGPRDVFSHLLAIIFLYVSVFAFGSIIFSLIDLYFPDALVNYGSNARDGLRWPLAVLVVVFPCYLWLTWYLARDVELHHEKRDLKTRKWLLYFTLFATAIAIVIDLITLIFVFLNGTLSTPFVLKIVAVLAVASAIFTYYLWTIRKATPALKHPAMRIFVYATVAIVTAVILFGFYMAGSPQAERMRRFDETRVQSLQQLQYQITNYWQAKQKLPGSLGDLVDSINLTSLPKDPVTGAEYEYRATGATSFELCAVFQAASDNSLQDSKSYPVGMYGEDAGFTHGAGRTCFQRTIDPDRFPPMKRM
jgi:hypothetical protein